MISTVGMFLILIVSSFFKHQNSIAARSRLNRSISAFAESLPGFEHDYIVSIKEKFTVKYVKNQVIYKH